MISRHTLAIIGTIGNSLNVVGSLYLAYDLLGGEHGPLWTLSRGVTHGVLFGAGYGIALGSVFGLVSGAAHGIALALELSRTARQGPEPGFWYEVTMSAIRGCGYALSAAFPRLCTSNSAAHNKASIPNRGKPDCWLWDRWIRQCFDGTSAYEHPDVRFGSGITSWCNHGNRDLLPAVYRMGRRSYAGEAHGRHRLP
jgi:hypothetical protein